MASETKIEWADSTMNPWIGCTRISPACDDCYAARSTPTRTRGIEWGAGKPRQRTGAQNWNNPVKWDRRPFCECKRCGWRGEIEETKGTDMCVHCGWPVDPARRRVFCASLADWLDNEVPIEWLVDLLDLIRRTPNLNWLLLTERIGNWRSRLLDAYLYATKEQRHEVAAWIDQWGDNNPPPNIWLGATVVNQDEADRDVPKLLQVPARIRFLSVEPMLGPVDVSRWIGSAICGSTHMARGEDFERCDITGAPCEGIDWIICGGESGPKARPMEEQWCRDLLSQCKAAGAAFHMKQMGGHPDKRGALEDLPEDLRVREFPA